MKRLIKDTFAVSTELLLLLSTNIIPNYKQWIVSAGSFYNAQTIDNFETTYVHIIKPLKIQ
jgi:hypothetical protein